MLLFHLGIHSKNKRYFQPPSMVLQLVTNGGLMSVPGGIISTGKDQSVAGRTTTGILALIFLLW